MRYVFRADASRQIGAGHAMRTSAIAEEFIAQGEEVFFLGEISEIPWVQERINGLGFSGVLGLDSNFITNPKCDVLIIDSYEIPVADHFIQPHKWYKVISIFDEQTPNYFCDLRIHPGISTEWKSISSVKTVSGPNFFPLRKSIPVSNLQVPGPILKILVVGGGSDTTGFVRSVSNILKNSHREFHAYLFSDEPDLQSRDSRFEVVQIGHSFDSIANNCHLAFTTASTTSLEFLARGCPVGIGCAVDNQEIYYQELATRGLASAIGRYQNGNWDLDRNLINQLIISQSIREQLINRSSGVIDSNGSKRILNLIKELEKVE
jgi:spore coat polysaccharide biosynthesis predicted glycosyltransferase SpsG